jgi:tRNA splicing endonuclease
MMNSYEQTIFRCGDISHICGLSNLGNSYFVYSDVKSKGCHITDGLKKDIFLNLGCYTWNLHSSSSGDRLYSCDEALYKITNLYSSVAEYNILEQSLKGKFINNSEILLLFNRKIQKLDTRNKKRINILENMYCLSDMDYWNNRLIFRRYGADFLMI